jgi:hypothetical protein
VALKEEVPLKLALVRVLLVVAVVAVPLVVGGVATTSAAPTCSDVGFLDVDVHGQHVIRDYVIGEDETGPGGEGVAIRGGPGPGFHFEFGIAPGASFCLPQSKSPGFHVS